MRFAEFKLLESSNNVVIIGDSIAVGLGGSEPYAKGGISTVEVLRRVNAFIQTGKAKGATVILSSGASNSAPIELEGGVKKPGNGGLGPVAEQLRALKQAGATVALVGTGSKKSIAFPGTSWTGGKKYIVDLTGVNEQLASMASATGATFLGPLEDFDQGLHSGKGDGIHPYGGYQKIKQAGSAVGRQGSGGMQSTAVDTAPSAKPVSGSTAFSIEVPAVSLGWKGASIMDVQKALMALGYDVGPTGADGIRGKNTIAAIRQYQTDRKLKVDGDPGPETTAALNKDIQSNPGKFTGVVKSKPDEVKQSSRVGQEYAPQPVAYDAVTKGKVGEVLNFAASKESQGYYDMMNGMVRKPEILKMTLNQANKFQQEWHRTTGNSSAMGRYQIMGNNPNNTVDYGRKAGFDLDKDLFSPENQDKMGIIFLKEKGLDAWLAGKLSDKDFLEGLSRVWAAIPAPSKNGRSFYDKVGDNKSGMTTDAALDILQNIRTA